MTLLTARTGGRVADLEAPSEGDQFRRLMRQ